MAHHGSWNTGSFQIKCKYFLIWASITKLRPSKQLWPNWLYYVTVVTFEAAANAFFIIAPYILALKSIEFLFINPTSSKRSEKSKKIAQSQYKRSNLKNSNIPTLTFSSPKSLQTLEYLKKNYWWFDFVCLKSRSYFSIIARIACHPLI